MALLKVSRIPNLNTLVIRQDRERSFFVASPTSLVIGISTLAFLLKFLIDNEYISYKILEGVLEEYHSNKGGKNGPTI
jgi:hypothetical protein